MKKHIIAVVVLAMGLTGLADASPTDTPSLDQRQLRQEQRIEQGVQSGRLTEKEAARMDRQQDKVQAVEDKAKSDGVVTKRERARLHKAQDKASRSIYRQKHDRQRQ